MLKYRLLPIALSLSFFYACTDILPDSADKSPNLPGTVLTKVINSPDKARNGVLLVEMEEKFPDISSILDSSLTAVGATSVEPLFTSSRKFAEAQTKYGLDRWFVIRFNDEIPLTEAAKAFNNVSQVRTIQYDSKVNKASDCVVIPYTQSNSMSRYASSQTVFNDPMLADQWHYRNTGDLGIASTAKVGADINVSDAWKLTAGTLEVIVAVVDEGVDNTHPDLAPNIWINQQEADGQPGVDDDGNGYVDDVYGWNCVYNNGNITWSLGGDSGHGTHVAGTVAAANNNNTGVCGVAGGSGSEDGTRIMSCQVFSGNSGGDIVSISRAAQYAAENGASILQCSLGYEKQFLYSDGEYEQYASAEYTALRYFIENAESCDAINGGIVIFAAGNEANSASSYPGAHHDFVSVTSISVDNKPAYYTNYGPGCNIAAPGGELSLNEEGRAAVLSTVPDEIVSAGYGYMQGTSMACPHMSGIAALGLSYALKLGRTFTRDEFISMLLTSVNDLNPFLNGSKGTIQLSRYRNMMGTGYADAWKFLMQIEGTPSITVPVGKTVNVDISQYFGEGASNLTYTGAEISEEDLMKLGMEESPAIRFGKLRLSCKKAGCCKIKVTAIAGGDSLGDDSGMGGSEISKEISIIARNVYSNNGGWL